MGYLQEETSEHLRTDDHRGMFHIAVPRVVSVPSNFFRPPEKSQAILVEVETSPNKFVQLKGQVEICWLDVHLHQLKTNSWSRYPKWQG